MVFLTRYAKHIAYDYNSKWAFVCLVYQMVASVDQVANNLTFRLVQALIGNYSNYNTPRSLVVIAPW